MATFIIDSIYVLGLSEVHTSTDWEVYIDDKLEEDKLLYRKLNDETDLVEKHVLLRYPNGALYEPSDPTYARCRVWFGDIPSNWFTILDKNCPIVYGYDLNALLHKAYASNKGISTYESSPYIYDIKKLKVEDNED